MKCKGINNTYLYIPTNNYTIFTNYISKNVKTQNLTAPAIVSYT